MQKLDVSHYASFEAVFDAIKEIQTDLTWYEASIQLMTERLQELGVRLHDLEVLIAESGVETTPSSKQQRQVEALLFMHGLTGE